MIQWSSSTECTLDFIESNLSQNFDLMRCEERSHKIGKSKIYKLMRIGTVIWVFGSSEILLHARNLSSPETGWKARMDDSVSVRVFVCRLLCWMQGVLLECKLTTCTGRIDRISFRTSGQFVEQLTTFPEWWSNISKRWRSPVLHGFRFRLDFGIQQSLRREISSF